MIVLLIFFGVAILLTRITLTTIVEIFLKIRENDIADEYNLNVEKILKFQVHDSLIKKNMSKCVLFSVRKQTNKLLGNKFNKQNHVNLFKCSCYA